MTPDLTLHHKLNEAARRIRLLLVLQWTGRTLLAAALACLVWLIAGKLGWLEGPSELSTGIVLGIAVGLGIVFGLVHKVTRMDVARLTDGRTDFKERLASAVEFERDNTADPLVHRQLQDTNARAVDLDLRRAYPLRATRQMIAAIVVTLCLFLAFLLPTFTIFWPRAKKQEIAEVKKQAADMQKVIRISEKTADQQKLGSSKQAAKEANKMLEAMKRSNTTKKAAMIQLSKMAKQLEQQQQKMAAANAPGQKSLQKASEEIKKALDQKQQAIEAADKAKKDAAKAAGKDGKKPGDKSHENKDGKTGEKQNAKAGESKQSQAMEQAQQALQKFAQALADQNAAKQNEALQQLADQMEKGQMSPKEMQSLQQQLQQLAQALKGTHLDKTSQQVKQMAEAMRQLKLDPETLKKLAKMMRGAGEQCKGSGKTQLDAKTLAEILQAIKDGKMKLAAGSGAGIPIPLPGMAQGKGKGKGTNGMGQPTKPLKGEVAGTPKATAIGKNGGLSVDSRVSKEFMKYAAMGHKDSKYKPNTQVQGVRNNNVTELQMNYKGDPDSQYSSGTPLFQPNGQPRRGVESAINKENIPAAYRRQVKEYFESINPNR